LEICERSEGARRFILTGMEVSVDGLQKIGQKDGG